MGVVIIVLSVIWLGIKFYIKDYYYGEKIEVMKDTVDDLNDIFSGRGNSPFVLNDLEYIGYQFGGKISIYDGNSVLTILNHNLGYYEGEIIKEIRHKDVVAYVLETEYPVKGTKWLLYGEELNNNKLAVLEIQIESIENTLDIVEKFFAYLVWLSIVIAAIFSVILSRNISKPVSEINKIAKEMGKLNFNHKYTGKRKDEIGQLGRTLNDIAYRLEKTIHELQLELAKEKKLDVLRKNFIAQVSHELQTPLSVINGYVEALTDGIVDTDDEREYYYEIIEDETSKMSKMVKELLDLSQFESGTFKMTKEMIDFANLLDVIALKYEKIAAAKNIIWVYNGLDNKEIVEVDPIRIEQAITNIINNALKHTEPGHRITVSAEKVNDNRIIMCIQNEGAQIPENQLGHIWESFYKAKTGQNKSGTGLGLAIAANIFKYHNMAYRAYNTNVGVAFEITIEVRAI
jgi:signal transduction histidine kinase